MNDTAVTQESASTSPPRRGRVTLAVGVLAGLLLAAVVVVPLVQAFGGDDADLTSAEHPAWPAVGPADATLAVGTASRHVGPQGSVGQFIATCDYSHSAPDDPIVFPGRPGLSHPHDFYGTVDVDAHTTPARMLASGTTCDKPADRASYWHPTVYDRGEALVPEELNAYYRAAPGVDPVAVETMPLGLAMIAGDMTATAPLPGDDVGWTCGVRTTLHDAPPDCPRSAPLHLVLTFQDCWDGEHLDSEDHRSHVVYSTDGACPDSHPVHIPQLTVVVSLPVFGSDHDLSLASGNVYSLHGDFFNGWEPDGLRREIEACIHRGVVCDLRNGRSEPIAPEAIVPRG